MPLKEKIFQNDIYFFEVITDKIIFNDNYCGIIICDKDLKINKKIFIHNNFVIDEYFINKKDEIILFCCSDNFIWLDLKTFSIKYIKNTFKDMPASSGIYFWDIEIVIKNGNKFYIINPEKLTVSDVSDISADYPHFANVYNWYLSNISNEFYIIDGNVCNELVLFNRLTNSINIVRYEKCKVTVTEKIIPPVNIEYHSLNYNNNIFAAISENEFVLNDSRKMVMDDKTLYYNKLCFMDINEMFVLVSSKENQYFSKIIKYGNL